MRQISLVNHQPRSLRLLLPPLDKSVPQMTGDPVVILAKEEEELGRELFALLRINVALNLPELLVPAVLANDLHLVHAHVQGLPDAVAALEEAGRDLGRVRREAQDCRHEPAQRAERPEPEKALGDGMRVGPDHGRAPQQLHLLPLARPADVLDRREQQDPGPEVHVGGRRRGVPQVPVEDLQRDVASDRVAHEQDVVVGLALLGTVFYAQRRQRVVRVLDLVFHIVGRVLPVERLVVTLAESCQVLAVDVKPGRLEIRRRINERPEAFKEGTVVVNQPGVAGDKEDQDIARGCRSVVGGGGV